QELRIFGKLVLPSGETNLGKPNDKISISNSVAANLWYEWRQTYNHNHSLFTANSSKIHAECSLSKNN
ncbi:MAG: hypothetical protein ACK47J_01960, partial [Pseudanabaena sp.]